MRQPNKKFVVLADQSVKDEPGACPEPAHCSECADVKHDAGAIV